jgi:hypothetical protein
MTDEILHPFFWRSEYPNFLQYMKSR